MKTPDPNARQEILRMRRAEKMSRSPHAYMRGNTAKYYEWLNSQHGHALPHGPAIWICGDCHVVGDPSKHRGTRIPSMMSVSATIDGMNHYV